MECCHFGKLIQDDIALPPIKRREYGDGTIALYLLNSTGDHQMTTKLPPPGAASPDDHTEISRQFLQHAKEELARDSRLQASEKTWGAMAHALKSIAQERGWRHRGHYYILDIGSQIADEFNIPAISDATHRANSLHENFYENNDNVEVISRTIDIVDAMLPELERIRSAAPRPFTIRQRYERDRLRQITGIKTLQIGDTSPVGFSQSLPPTPTA